MNGHAESHMCGFWPGHLRVQPQARLQPAWFHPLNDTFSRAAGRARSGGSRQRGGGRRRRQRDKVDESSVRRLHDLRAPMSLVVHLFMSCTLFITCCEFTGDPHVLGCYYCCCHTFFPGPLGSCARLLLVCCSCAARVLVCCSCAARVIVCSSVVAAASSASSARGGGIELWGMLRNFVESLRRRQTLGRCQLRSRVFSGLFFINFYRSYLEVLLFF